MCAGGVIAFEIARKLQEIGQEVALVALIDAADVKAKLKPWRLTNQRIRRLSSDMRRVNQDRLDRQVLAQFTRVAVKAKNLGCYLVDRQAKIVLDEIKTRLFRFCTDRRYDLPRQLQQIPVRTLYLFAEKQFNPQGSFAGEVVLFRATQGENDDEPYIERFQDPLLGWSPRTRRSASSRCPWRSFQHVAGAPRANSG